MNMNAMYETVDPDTTGPDAGPDAAHDSSPVYSSALEVADPASARTDDAIVFSAGTAYAIPVHASAAHSYAQPHDSVAGADRAVALRNDAYEGVPEGYLEVETSAC